MLDQLFEKINSELLNDEVKLEMSAMFEAAVNEAVASKEVELEEANRQEISDFKDSLITKLDEYLAYFTEEFTQKNEQEIEDQVKIETAGRVLSVFESIVNDFNMKLSDEVVTNEEELEEAKRQISEQTEEILALRKEKQEILVANMIESFASETFEIDADKEKFVVIAENLTFSDEEGFKAKLQAVSESMKKDSKKSVVLEEEQEEYVDEESLRRPSRMSNYLTQL